MRGPRRRPGDADAKTAGRPNIVLIITDQQRFDTIAALGFPYAHTPNLDRLVEEGVSFTNCHITAPSCVPSRASLFNGHYPHTTGVLANGQAWQRSWVEQLRDAGYRCVNVGKMHTIPYGAEAGFHERYVVENKDRYLEGRWYFDEWDKALAANGLVKQQREGIGSARTTASASAPSTGSCPIGCIPMPSWATWRAGGWTPARRPSRCSLR